jgi:hypothetical protein
VRNRLALLALGLFALPLLALDPKDARAEYDRLQKWQFSGPMTLAAPVSLTRDTATWTLTSGTVRAMEPSAEGLVSGFVFEGQGTFRMTVPDRYEAAQLRRFAQKNIDAVDQPFTQLVIRTSDPAVAKLFPAASVPYGPHPPATKRHESWLVDQFEDIDARVVAALLNSGGMQFTADMKSADFDWLTYHYDSSAAEEISLVHTDSRGTESWISLDRPEERMQDGRPAVGLPRASLEHIDVKADLTKLGRDQVGENRQRMLNGRYVVESTFTGLAADTSALRLGLLPSAKNLKAYDVASGAELAVFRDHIGKRTSRIDNKYYDDELMVVLGTPLRKGEKQKIRFEYELETANYAPGNAWYPTVPEAFEQRHTARLELTVRRKNELRAMGRMDKRTETGDSETSVWIVDRPAKMITFSTATRFEEVKVSPPGIPPVIAFGPDFQFTNTQKLHNVGADVANSMQYFQQLLGSNVAAEQYYVTSIAAGHGQAFDGFLHMTEWTYAEEHPGASELFRAHEVAHAWWGHKVGWKSYRDQWLSEAFAEYCAMLFVRDVVKGGDKYFDEILRTYDSIVKGNLSGGFSKFNRPWLLEFNKAYRNRLGPIGHGWRASTNEMPDGYTIQTYHKGPLVVHMLRMIIALRMGNDDAFYKTLKDFLNEYDGKAASTEDFRRVLERNLGGNDMGWFFDSWIYRAEIPSYTWSYTVKPDGDAFLLTIDVERRDVPDDFVTTIPIRIEFEGNKGGTIFLPSRQAKQSVTQRVPSRPKNVVFAPNSSLLASIKRN